jgi:hypothetical protein
MTKRLLRRLAAGLALAVVAAACGSADRPFDRVQLIPSYWDIVSINGSVVTGSAPLRVAIGRSNSARLELQCGEIDLRYTSDQPGSALTFVEQRLDAACQAPVEPGDAAIRRAVADVRAWRVISDSSIELVDGGGTALLSLQATTCDCPHQLPGEASPTSS